MTHLQPNSLSDFALLTETARVAAVERDSTCELLSLLGELDRRRIYLGRGYSSLFVYCTQALHLSESAAYSRITAARAARTFPIVLTLLAEGAITLTTVSLLAAHLTPENHEGVLCAASHKSKREIERLVGCLAPQPDIPSTVRQIASASRVERAVPVLQAPGAAAPELTVRQPGLVAGAFAPSRPVEPTASCRPVVAPLSASRYLLKVTLSDEAHSKLQRIRALARHSIPSGDPAAIIERALTVLLEHLEKTKHASTPRPKSARITSSSSRRVPAAARRAVWTRDEGQCAFVGVQGRCRETAFLEFHHVVPFAAGGATGVDNLQLRCRAHNAYEAERDFGPPARDGGTLRRRPTLSGQSPATLAP
jgi:5-methylcytosine-specific restriction endonuclease McrA